MHLTWWAGQYCCSYAMERRSVRCNDGYIREVVGRGAGESIAPIIWDFAPIHYLLNNKIPIYCLPLQYQFSDYLPGFKSGCHRQKIFGLLALKGPPLSVHNNVSACHRQKIFGFERAPSLSLQQCKCLPQAENLWLWKGPSAPLLHSSQSRGLLFQKEKFRQARGGWLKKRFYWLFFRRGWQVEKQLVKVWEGKVN